MQRKAAMHTLLVFDHPYGAMAHDNVPHRRSFSAALLAAALEGLSQAGHTTDVIDLGADGFDPVVSADDLRAWRQDSAIDPMVLDYQRRLAAADHLVFVHPVYWMVMPAGTKGFLDRVLTRGFAFAERKPGALLQRRLMRLRRVTILSPLTTPLPFYLSIFGAPAVRTLATGTFRLIGIPSVRWQGFAGMAQRTPAQRQRALDGVRRRFARLA